MARVEGAREIAALTKLLTLSLGEISLCTGSHENATDVQKCDEGVRVSMICRIM